jgi:DNA-binding MarR family transcriptional regulator
MDGEEPIGLLIGAARRRIKQAVGSRALGFRLTTQQFWVLIAISEHPGCTVGELAAHLRMDNPTASRLVFTVAKRKLVEVRADAADRRRARVFLRAPGQALTGKLHELAATVRTAVVHGLTADEQAMLRVGLRKVIANMDRFQHGDPSAMSPGGSTKPGVPRTAAPPGRPRRRGRS